MSNSLFVMTRRRKIGFLVTCVAILCVVAALSTYYEDTSAESRDIDDQRPLKLRPRKRHNNAPYERSAESRIPHDHNTKRRSHKHLDDSDAISSQEKDIVGNLKKGHRKSSSKRNKGNRVNEPGSTISIKMAANTDDRFDANRVLQLFTSCRKPDDEILIDCYVDAYEELCKLFKAFGTVFGLVTSDVVEKIRILRDYRKSPEAEHYASIQSMLSYEVEKEITNNKKKASGSRTLLRLHRALEFIEELVIKIRDTSNKDKFSSVATKAYDDTLAKHHPWLIKKAVHVAMYVLPSRADLLKKMQLEDSENGMEALSKLIDEIKIIYKITQDLYVKDNLLDLP